MELTAGVASHTIRVLVVDDHSAVRCGLEALLDGEPGLEPVAAAASAKEALALAQETQPEVAIVDFQLGDQDGLALCRQLTELRTPVRVVIYSAFADGPLALAGLIAGADGIVHKSALAGELCEVVRSVAAGRRVIPPVTPGTQAVVAARLDPRDLPILAMLVDGTEPDEIARVLDVEPGWLRARRWAMLERLRRMPPRARAAASDGRDWPPGLLRA